MSLLYIVEDEKAIYNSDFIWLDIMFPDVVTNLLSRVKAIIRYMNRLEGEKTMRFHDIFMDNEKRIVYVSGDPCGLTYKEFDLLKLFLQNAGIVLPRENIMKHVWGVNLERQSRTLDMHIKTLRQKLGNAGNYIKTVRNIGYRMEKYEEI